MLPFLGPLQPRTTQPGGGERTLLTQSDFTYLGMFRMPETVSSLETGPGRGLTHRYVESELRFLSTAYELDEGFQIYEVVAPLTLGSSVGTSPVATLDRVWGYPAPDSVAGIYNLHWDPVGGHLYFLGGDSYIDNGVFMCIGRVTLDDVAGTMGAAAHWRFNSRSSKMCMHGVTPVPDWFSAAYCPGQRLAAGFGGYESLVMSGPASIGPALTAFDPSALPASGGAIVNHTPLLSYFYNAQAYGPPTPAHRDTDYQSEFANAPEYWNPQGGVGYWTWADYIWGGGCWIDTPTKTGFLVLPVPGINRVWYEESKLHAENCKHTWHVYDPADLARVAQGLDSEDTPQPAESWDEQYAGLSYPLDGWADLPWKIIGGATFDITTGRVYVSVCYGNGADPTPNPNVVHVYQIAA